MKKGLLIAALTTTAIYGDGMTSDISTPTSYCAENFLPKYNNHPYFVLDFIYWAAKQEGNTYAETGKAITVPGTADPHISLTPGLITGAGEIYAPEPTASPGFKVALGMNLEYDAWDLFLDYSFLYGTQDSAVSSENLNTGIIPLFFYAPNNSIFTACTFDGGSTGYIENSHAHWMFQYNNMHLELTKSIPLHCQMVLNPHFGLQGAWIRQHFHSVYVINSVASLTTAIGGSQTHFVQSFWGVGPTFGVNGLWHCCKHLGFFGNSGLALLWGNYDTALKAFETNGLRGYTGVQVADQKYDPTTLSPVLELSLGASSDWMLYNKYRFVLDLSWDAQVWFSHNQHSSSIADTDLIFQGLTAGVRFDF